MQKSLAITLILAVIASTLCMYLYDRWSQAEEKYNFLRTEYLKLLEERGKLTEEQVSFVEEKKSLAARLENCTEMLEKTTERKRDAERRVEELKELLSLNPERWVVRLEGSPDEKIEKAKLAVKDSLNSPIISKFAEMIVVTDAVYLNGKKFSFDYVEDESMFDEKDAIVNPEWFLLHRVGDCDDVAAAMAAVMKVKGYEVKFCIGHREGKEGEPRHAWVRLENGDDIDYRYCLNRVCKIEVGYFGNIAEKCVEI